MESGGALQLAGRSLKAQAVAARTYLAFTLAQGRTTTAAHTATTFVQPRLAKSTPGGGSHLRQGLRWQPRWLPRPARFFFMAANRSRRSTAPPSGTRTRESEDVFPGLNAPYLVAVDSPGEDSPFVDWSFAVTEGEMETLLAAEGLLAGPLHSIGVTTTRTALDPGK